MSLMSDLVARLQADTSVAALVSTRVYERPPQSPAKPYIVLTEISEVHPTHTGGSSALVTVRMQVDAYAANPTSRRLLGDAIHACLHTFRGEMGTGGVNVRSCVLDAAQNMTEPPTDGTSSGVFRKTMDFLITHVCTAVTPS